MNESLTSPLPMAIVGVSTVFFALVTIVAVVSVNGYLAQRERRNRSTVPEVKSANGATTPVAIPGK